MTWDLSQFCANATNLGKGSDGLNFDTNDIFIVDPIFG